MNVALLISFFIVAAFAIGMGLSFIAADATSPTSRALALTLCLIGLSMLLNVAVQAGFQAGLLRGLLWERVFSLVEGGIMTAFLEWVLRVGRTESHRQRRTAASESALRVAQGLAIAYGLIGAVLPQTRNEIWQRALFDRPGFYVFAVPFSLVLALATIDTVPTGASDIDPSERVRLNALGAATPFLAATVVVPLIWKPATLAVGLTVFLSGAIRYHVLQGRRGQFLARFLSPQLARLVRERGLAGTMQQNRLQLSVVACDLRGFTAFAESAAPEDVIQFLREYYETVGQVVGESDGTIISFAGDGIVSLVGAPIPFADHAQRAVRIGLGIWTRGRDMLSRWQKLGLELGLGVGVASGFVTVGTIGSADHLEYTAVGPAVNLAARLSSHAMSGQILVDQRTVGLVGENNGLCKFDRVGSAELKGLARRVELFSAVAS
jgi:class 3 adenylate cyclase